MQEKIHTIPFSFKFFPFKRNTPHPEKDEGLYSRFHLFSFISFYKKNNINALDTINVRKTVCSNLHTTVQTNSSQGTSNSLYPESLSLWTPSLHHFYKVEIVLILFKAFIFDMISAFSLPILHIKCKLLLMLNFVK